MNEDLLARTIATFIIGLFGNASILSNTIKQREQEGWKIDDIIWEEEGDGASPGDGLMSCKVHMHKSSDFPKHNLSPALIDNETDVLVSRKEYNKMRQANIDLRMQNKALTNRVTLLEDAIIETGKILHNFIR